MEKTNGEDVPSKTKKNENRMSYSVETPYGFHLDLDFLKYVHDIEKGNTIKRIHIHRRAKQSKFSTLPRNFSVPDSGSQYYSSTASRTWSPNSYKADVKDGGAITPSESSLRLRYVHELNYRRKDNAPDAPRSVGDVCPEDFSGCRERPQFLRATSMPATLPQSTMSSDHTQYLKLPQAVNSHGESRQQHSQEPQPPSHTGPHNQIAEALTRIQDLENQLKAIPELKKTISVLEGKNNMLSTRLKSLSGLFTDKKERDALELTVSESEPGAGAVAVGNGESLGQLSSPELNDSVFSGIERQIADLKDRLRDSTRELQNLKMLVEKQSNDIKAKDAHIGDLEKRIGEKEEIINSGRKVEAQCRDIAVNTERVQIKDLQETCDQSMQVNVMVDTSSVGCGEMTVDREDSRLCENCERMKNHKGEASDQWMETYITEDPMNDGHLVCLEEERKEAIISDGSQGRTADDLLETHAGGSKASGCEQVQAETKDCPVESQGPPDPSVGKYVQRIQDLLQEQWTYLEKGSPDLASAVKQPASKLSSIYNQLVNTLDLLSSVYSTQSPSEKESSRTGSQPLEASPKSSLKSIMKKKSSSCSSTGGHKTHTKKNLQFVGVNGGYETTSSEDSSEEYCAPDNEKEEASAPARPGDDGNNRTDDALEPDPERKPGDSAESPEPNVSETQQTAQRFVVSDSFRHECQILSSHLEELQSTTDNQLRQSLYTVCQEWFRVSSQDSSSPDLVAVYLEDLESVSPRLLQMVVNIADENGNTALHYSVSHSNFGIVRLLLRTGVCDVDHQNKAGYTPVMLTPLAAAETDEDMEVVLELLNSGDLNLSSSPGGQTALMLAVSHGRSDMVKVLLNCGADANLQDKDGESALMMACQLGSLEIVKLLAARPECDFDLSDQVGNTALSIVLNSAHTEIAEFLQAHAALRHSSPPTETEKGT
ncbi:KN motif and ankyrin repeat domain-containing protein 4 isoform X2 [Spea bombifrons]|uniref:KN motif and ankyrin repeat domain-containing protein 4 isoform X2 n=1 Tax=Spea bombifrons TaxID=233779 RepID=UPI00234A25AB|nr:KN motif and ankyrin repeat domain-containing protein 4 isoform X2 [Spea bombifrons]